MGSDQMIDKESRDEQGVLIKQSMTAITAMFSLKLIISMADGEKMTKEAILKDYGRLTDQVALEFRERLEGSMIGIGHDEIAREYIRSFQELFDEAKANYIEGVS